MKFYELPFAAYVGDIALCADDHTGPQLDTAGTVRRAHRGSVPRPQRLFDVAEALVDLHTIVEDLVGRGVSVRFLREGQTYSAKADPIAKLMLGLMGSVADFERSIIRERQAQGIARAKARDVYKGRAKVLPDGQVAQTQKRVADGVPKAEVARRLEIGRTALYKYLANGVG